MPTKKSASKRKRPAKQEAGGGCPEATCSPFVFCEADLKKGRTIKAEQGEGMFRFTLSAGRKTRKIEMSDDEAWIVGKIISAMHPSISGSNDPLWHQIQEQRKIILENATAQTPPDSGTQNL